MHIAVCTVMVCDDEAGIRYHAAGTAEIKGYDGIGYRSPFRIGIVYFIRGQFQPALFHLLLQGLVDAVYHPHPFVSP